MRKQVAGPVQVAAAVFLLTVAGCATPGNVPSPTAAAVQRASSTPMPTRVVRHPAPPVSWLRNSVVLTIYGRALATAPILGRLGMDSTLADVAAQAAPFLRGITSQNPHKHARLALHLIYGIATPCSAGSNCLGYLDDAGVDILAQYIRPAARRGWLVILDTQLGASTPLREVNRMIAKGYLKYDNVQVAVDPEFRATPGQSVPGIPVGTVPGSEINAAESRLNQYMAAHRRTHRILMLIHEFQYGMVPGRGTVRLHLPWVDPVFVMDGFGDPGVKAHVYHELLSKRNAPRLMWRGLKLFYPNPYEQAGHGDTPLMSWPQVFGHAPALDVDGRNYWVSPPPQVVIVA